MVRVVIERWVRPGMEHDLVAALRAMRGDAIHAPGYIGGEILRDAGDAAHWVILSTWHSRADWDRWAECEARQRGRTLIAPLLAQPEQVAVLEPA